jgi:hypothetical protein
LLDRWVTASDYYQCDLVWYFGPYTANHTMALFGNIQAQGSPLPDDASYGSHLYVKGGDQTNPTSSDSFALFSDNELTANTQAGLPMLSWTKFGNFASLGSCLPGYNGWTFIISDMPENRMSYRPWRYLVDSAIYKEQKLLFIPTHERTDFAGGLLGIPAYGQTVPFRFEQLFDAGFSDQFILEKPATKTRMVDPSNRGMLTFTKVALLDEDTGRHELAEVTRTINSKYMSRATKYSMSVTDSVVYSRAMIRSIQLGRQMQAQRS